MMTLWNWISTLRRFQRQRSTYLQLLALTDDQLDDIGFSRQQLEREASRYGIGSKTDSRPSTTTRRWLPWNTQP